jgi:hypothetical protein
MLRSIRVSGPVVAAIMVVVLLFEPPTIRPADRIPTLHVFTSRPEIALDPAQIRAAIAAGERDRPVSYLLQRVTAGRPQPDEAAGVVYTPFQRVAWAAHVLHQAGRPLDPERVPTWMTAPEVWIALRRPRGSDLTPALTVVPPDVATCCLEPQPTLVRPLWRAETAAAIARFGATLPFPDLGMVAAFPLEVLSEEVDFVAFQRIETDGERTSLEMRGRAPPEARRTWK